MNINCYPAEAALARNIQPSQPEVAFATGESAKLPFERHLENARGEFEHLPGVKAMPAGNLGVTRKPFLLWETNQGFGFGDFIDIVNPLQHIPIVATIYRKFSGDQIGAASRIIGGALWGRVGGFVAGVANALVEWWSGKDIGDHVYAAVFDSPTKGVKALAVAPENRSSPMQTSPPVPSFAEMPVPKSPARSERRSSFSPADYFSGRRMRWSSSLMASLASDAYQENRRALDGTQSRSARFAA
jgi:hypothetical protein